MPEPTPVFVPLSALDDQAQEIWTLHKRIRSLEYRLRQISANTDVPQWVRDYAAGKKETLEKTNGIAQSSL